jgi:hypothetical protein
LVRDLIAASFSTLEPQKVRLQIVRTKKFFASSGEDYIRLNKSDLRRMPWPALIGLLAHELCHIENRQTLGWFANLIFDCRYKFSDRFRTRTERATDQATITKGYGAELLALQEYHDQRYEDYDPSDGLTQQEIRAAVQSAGMVDRAAAKRKKAARRTLQ